MSLTPLPPLREVDNGIARSRVGTRRRSPFVTAPPRTRPPASPRARRIYLPVAAKYLVALAIASGWTLFSVWVSIAWLKDLAAIFGWPVALFAIGFIAWVPGFMNAFLIASVCLDRRPQRRPLADPPGVSVLVACFNEAEHIGDTIRSLSRQDFSGPMQVIILDDGSTDATVQRAREAIAAANPPARFSFHIVIGERNTGKANVLNRGLALARHGLVATVDGDSWLLDDALRHMVERYVADPPSTRAVAGAVLVRNSRRNWLTRMQEWDYFHGIAAVKRMQSLFHGTLVAQGAFSLYDREAVRAAGGWQDVVGEDIVLTWALLEAGWRVGYCEDALVFTSVPETLAQFTGQRKRWSRGMLEGFRLHWRLLFKRRLSTLFVWWNLLFVPLDVAFTFVFVPGVVLALFGYPLLASMMTLLILPLAALWNAVIFRVQHRMFKREDLKVRSNWSGFLSYALVYSLIMQPVCLAGYAAELFGQRKLWNTK